MDSRYRIEDTRDIISPGLVVFPEIIEENLARMISIAGRPERLRPHCKTHKMREIIELELEHGITRHKCATFAEAEMLVEAGARDVFLAYNPVGPNIERAVEFVRRNPNVAFSVTADHEAPIVALSEAMSAAGARVRVLLDIDSGQGRTGVRPGLAAETLYALIAESEGLELGGLHLYDGQNHQSDPQERRAAVDECWTAGTALKARLEKAGHPVPAIVAGGTGSFPIFATKNDPALELSPGTCVLHDAGYERMFPDMDFTAAALLLTRVISRPTRDRVTFDLGSKACASDPPAGARLAFPDIPDAREVLQNEEHLVIETQRAGELMPGDETLAIPVHICPTSALHKQAFVVEGGELVGRWDVAARDRWLTI